MSTAIPQRRCEAAPAMKPTLITDYNMNINCVDKCYRYLNYYSLGRKANKWWKKVFFWLLELGIIDSMVLFFSVRTEFGSKKNAHKKFREAFVHEIVQPLLDQRANPAMDLPRPSRRASLGAKRLKEKHFSEGAEVTRCFVCSYQKKENGKYKDTKATSYCRKCKEYICLKCFESYHTKSKVQVL